MPRKLRSKRSASLYSAIGGSQASFWIPYEAGIFRKHGLDVELLYVAGGGRAGQVVQSGEVPIGVFTGGAVINANLAGGDLVVIASSMNVMTFSVMARPEIKRPEDLKGKKIGISRFGSATDFGLRYVEEQWPVKRQRDFAVIQVGGVTDVYNALRAGALDAAVVNAELAILARRDGFRELADIAKMGINFPTSSAVTTRSLSSAMKTRCGSSSAASSKASTSPRPSAAPAIKIMQKYLRSSDASMFDELYEMYIMRNIPRIPRPSPESLKTVLDQMVETDPRVANLKPEQFIDARFFQELEKEGFIQKLWK